MAIEDFQFPTIDAVAKRLYEIPNTGRVRACLEQPEDIERFEELTYGGIVQLVEEFNRIDIADPLIEFMPGVKRLKDILGNQQLPLPEEISARDFIRGLRQARELMIRGQDLSDGKILRDTHYAKAAIQTPSMNTHELALAVGTSLHLYERSVFEMMTRLGIAESTEWTKDDVLFALEDLALLMHAQSVMHSDCQDAILYDLMTFPAGSDPETD
ncbi:MAG: hypothetical protein U9Q67_04205, partial [Patescibacteria group bacterium]|nr:hypothetical protein [Patescibacteria group bacterium]